MKLINENIKIVELVTTIVKYKGQEYRREKSTSNGIVDIIWYKYTISTDGYDVDHRSWETVIDKNTIDELEKDFKRTCEPIDEINKENEIEFIEYTDNDDNYIEPERIFCNDWVDIRLYCLHKGCKQYIKGKEGYNGLFVTENGKQADLRNQCWFCEKHDKPETETFVDFNV